MNNMHNVEKTMQKFQQLAKDAQSNGDPVLAQNYLQHADHYLRRFNELSERKENNLNQDEIKNKDKTVEGFNLGTNAGKVSGQSILHCHFHLIPRRHRDVDNPQGGVRSVIPNKQHYKRKI